MDTVLGDTPFFADDTLTIADLIIAPQLHLISPVGEVREPLNGTCLFPWLERMLALPAMVVTSLPAALKLPISLLDLQAA